MIWTGTLSVAWRVILWPARTDKPTMAANSRGVSYSEQVCSNVQGHKPEFRKPGATQSSVLGRLRCRTVQRPDMRHRCWEGNFKRTEMASVPLLELDRRQRLCWLFCLLQWWETSIDSVNRSQSGDSTLFRAWLVRRTSRLDQCWKTWGYSCLLDCGWKWEEFPGADTPCSALEDAAMTVSCGQMPTLLPSARAQGSPWATLQNQTGPKAAELWRFWQLPQSAWSMIRNRVLHQCKCNCQLWGRFTVPRKWPTVRLYIGSLPH